MSDNGQQVYRIRYGSRMIAFELEYRKRKTLEISVHPDTSVQVVAPLDRTLDEIREKVRKRASWILEQQRFFSLFLPQQPPRRYVSGETHAYLGKMYRLRTLTSTEERVMLKRGIIYVYIGDRSDPVRVKQLLDAWYRERAMEKFHERMQLCSRRTRKYGIEEPALEIRTMSKRWGSCSKEGRLLLNSHLVKAPSHCIDYVITHELCHKRHFGHSHEFYELLTRLMPDWRARKNRLEQVVL